MRTQRIFILSQHTLLARGVERLLHGRRGLRVVGTETDSRQGIQRIQTLHPDVVITGGESGGSPSLDTVSAVFEVCPETAVIGLYAGDNRIHVYEDKRIDVAQVEDLIRVIRQVGAPRGPTRERSLAGRGERKSEEAK